MNWVRDFTVNEGHNPPVRNVEDAPAPMRQELIDLVYGLSEQNPHAVPERRIHGIIGQSLGVDIAGEPYGGSVMLRDATLDVLTGIEFMT